VEEQRKKAWHEPNMIDIDIKGIKQFTLLVSEVDNNTNDHADWAMED